MRVLITGVGGHLGSRFAQWLLKRQPQAEVVGVDNFSCGYRENVPQGIELHELDLAADRLEPLFHSRCDYVFHFAAYAAECLSPFIRKFNYANNLLATAALINGAIRSRACRRFVLASSIAVYGEGEPPFAETHPCRPIDPYGVAKLACEMDLHIAGQQHGLDWCIVRPHNIYGPGQSLWQRYRNVFGIWMRAALEHQPLQVFGDGRQLRAFSYIDDILPCLWRAATVPDASKQVINLGGAEPVSIAAAARLVADITGGPPIEHLEPRHEVKRAWCSVERSQRLLDYQERTQLALGLEQMWSWARQAWHEHPDRRRLPDPFQLELEEGLYSFWQDPLSARAED